MLTVQKYIKLLSCTNDTELEKVLSRMSDSEIRQAITNMIQFFREREIDENDLIQFFQEQNLK